MLNSSSWEAWDGYYCFFSSSVDPKIREKEIKRKEDNKSQANKDRTTAYTHFRNAPDFENAGVAIVVKGTLVDSLKDIEQISYFRRVWLRHLLFCASMHRIVHMLLKKKKAFMICYQMRSCKLRVLVM